MPVWLHTEQGYFFSCVIDRDDTSRVVVRSRDKESSEALAEFVDGEVVEIPGDYAYRVFCTRDEWESFVVDKIRTAKATNFKSEVQKNLGATKKGRIWMDALHDIWFTMYDVQSKLRHPAGIKKKYEVV